jgi:hypothetical protein
MAFLRGAIQFQGVYFVLAGAWPIVSISSFMQVTGPKADLWLVKMVGALAVAIGISLLLGALKKPLPVLVYQVAGLSALAFGTIDVAYVFSDTISSVYLVDAVCELFFLFVAVLGGWITPKAHQTS